MSIDMNVYVGYADVMLEVDNDEWLEYMDECNVSLYDVLEHCGAKVVDAGLREYLCIDGPDGYVDRECLKVLVRVVNDANKRVYAEETKKHQSLAAEEEVKHGA